MSGVWSWVTTVDHKRIGILYGVTAFFFFLVGGLEALVIRLQLGAPGNTLDNLTAWIRDPAAIKPGVKMPALGLGEAEARAVAAYLAGLK